MHNSELQSKVIYSSGCKTEDSWIKTEDKFQIKNEKIGDSVNKELDKINIESACSYVSKIEKCYENGEDNYQINYADRDNPKSAAKNEEINIKPENVKSESYETTVATPQSILKEEDAFPNKNPPARMTNVSPYETEFEKYLNKEHFSLYFCQICSFQTFYEQDLHKHMEDHEPPIYKCDLCTYEAKHKYIIKSHMLIHKDPSQLMMYKCEICPYQAKRKNLLKSHMVIHKDPSETRMHKCTICSYKAKRKENLNTHMLVHKNPLDVTMYKCKTCPFESKYKSTLKIHVRKHVNSSQ